MKTDENPMSTTVRIGPSTHVTHDKDSKTVIQKLAPSDLVSLYTNKVTIAMFYQSMRLNISTSNKNIGRGATKRGGL